MNKLINNLTSISKRITGVILASSIAFSAWAISLDDAKKQGLVGEMQNGYLGVVVDSAQAKSLVNEVNEKRKNIYLNLARKNKITLEQVTALAGNKAVSKTQSGHFIQNSAGKWVKKQ
ncbi:MAG: DUF1318 domain-containing protein [Colwellia polaris]|jgi:uncharacterized protein YdbL (DUF1318 family)|uniref:YdbL family protein n=1 Tax=Colwellia polaris TaxID=326537 RepID=UPI000A177972|nr:YdbL family protein [Colwellia polaris]|tara:strand:+ start:79 stop:432 length:354 start_codon:yes stop_codon:yes gene_type:complete